ncbi:MAG: ScyD/ScyE family protein [Thermomicrobiales bacterium]
MPRKLTLLVALLAAIMAAPLAITSGSGVAGVAGVAAQDATPVGQATPTAGGITVAAGGLNNPRGVAWDASGALYVAAAGLGGENPATGTPIPPPIGPFMGGPTASVSRIDNGCPIVVAGDLPSAIDATMGVIGASDVAFLDDQLYVVVAGGGESHGNPDTPNGVYAVNDDGSTTLVADLSAWVGENPVANVPPGDFDPEGNFFAMVAAPDGSALWIAESNNEQIISVTPDGAVSRMADLSITDQVPTAIAAAPDGGMYVGFLSGAPFPDGAAKVVEVAPDGTMTDVWTNLTTVTGLVVDADGTLWASQMSTGNTAEPPFLVPGSGTIVRQTGPDTAEEIVTGLLFPVSLDVGPDGALYTSVPALGAQPGGGLVLRIDPTAGIPLDASTADLTPPACEAPATPELAPAASPVAEAVTVRIVDFAFDPTELTVSTGTTVTWVNDGPTDHTAVAFDGGDKVWDSDILAAGGEYSFTFDEPGAYDYVCGLHPEMTAHIDVVS